VPCAGHQSFDYGTDGMRYTMRDMAEGKLVVMKLS